MKTLTTIIAITFALFASTANAQTKAELNKQIQQMNLEKQKLQKQIAAFEIKTRETNIANMSIHGVAPASSTPSRMRRASCARHRCAACPPMKSS